MCLALCFSGMLPERQCHAQNTKKVDGLNFQVPEDWPIEKRGGVLGPIPTEEYVSMKFKDIDEEFESLKSELRDKISELQSNLDNLGSQLSKGTNNSEEQGAAQGAVGVDVAGILARLDEVESQLGRLDRKLTSKLMDVQKVFEENNLRAQTLEKSFEELQTQFFKLDEEVGYIAEKQRSAY
ncbi:MAG: hypothetical protein A3C36_06570 [Omnitrophica WOR_2 bacterium RIFCSPHIGHO2_02_FULL_52_10]|nr:MAG: hypothetical protein A3C36_06570 [Omnitrophica WOR_2 bacterium RIFCSPHIGHO2_02_FULL_52_10]